MINQQELLSALGEPYYEAEGVLLYQGDCAALLAALPDEAVDLTVTSPPYNLGKEYESRFTYSLFSVYNRMVRKMDVRNPLGDRAGRRLLA